MRKNTPPFQKSTLKSTCQKTFLVADNILKTELGRLVR